jgi:hypothetical protein
VIVAILAVTVTLSLLVGPKGGGDMTGNSE